MIRSTLLVTGALVVASCSSAGSDASGESRPSSEPGRVTSIATRERDAPPPVTSVPVTSTSTTVTAPTSPAPTTSTLVPEAADVAEPSDADGAVTLDELARREDAEPVFELGQTVELDVDLARFPVDDAGQGGSAAAPADDAGLGTPNALTGWVAFDAALEAALVRSGNTSAAVAVMIGGELVHTAAFGVRDPARGDPAQPTDRWRIASISKPITAIVALDLVEEGLIGLDEPIGQRIADHVGAGPVSGAARSLTLRRLLNHTSGFGREYTTFFQRGADDCADAARQGLGRASGGGGYTYSNMNYCLAGMLIEAVTGQTLERASYERLLTPLGISGMRLAPTVDPGPGEAQHRTAPGRAYMETLGGAGGWIASPADLVTIVDSLDHSTGGVKPLEPATVFQMLTPQGGTPGRRGYGLGIISYGQGRYGHTGTIESTHAMVLNRGDGVVWALTVAGDWPAESERLESIVDAAFTAGGFVAG